MSNAVCFCSLSNVQSGYEGKCVNIIPPFLSLSLVHALGVVPVVVARGFPLPGDSGPCNICTRLIADLPTISAAALLLSTHGLEYFSTR